MHTHESIYDKLSKEVDYLFAPNTHLLTAIRTSPTYEDYISYLESQLGSERQVFENSAANEFTRGRIDMLKSLLHELRG